MGAISKCEPRVFLVSEFCFRSLGGALLFSLPFEHVVSDEFVRVRQVGVGVALICAASVVSRDAQLRHPHVGHPVGSSTMEATGFDS